MSINLQQIVDEAFAAKEAELSDRIAEIASLRQDIAVLDNGIDERDAEIVRLTKRVAELEAGLPQPEEPQPEPEEPEVPAPPTRFPDPSTTGVPAGTPVARTHNGALHIKEAGKVISGWVINGVVIIEAPNVTVEKCWINPPPGTLAAVEPWNGSAIVKNCTVDGKGNAKAAIMGGGLIEGNKLIGCEDGIKITFSAQVWGNFIGGLKSNTGEPHHDGIMIQGENGRVVGNIQIEGNTIEAFDTSCIFIQNAFGSINGVEISGNRLVKDPNSPTGKGPSFAIYVEQSRPSTTIKNVSITGNVIEKGAYGPYFSIVNCNPTVSGNVDAITGKSI